MFCNRQIRVFQSPTVGIPQCHIRDCQNDSNVDLPTRHASALGLSRHVDVSWLEFLLAPVAVSAVSAAWPSPWPLDPLPLLAVAFFSHPSRPIFLIWWNPQTLFCDFFFHFIFCKQRNLGFIFIYCIIDHSFHWSFWKGAFHTRFKF